VNVGAKRFRNLGVVAKRATCGLGEEKFTLSFYPKLRHLGQQRISLKRTRLQLCLCVPDNLPCVQRRHCEEEIFIKALISAKVARSLPLTFNLTEFDSFLFGASQGRLLAQDSEKLLNKPLDVNSILQVISSPQQHGPT
jgi:hypothetical protein